jgi:hypothetical protein
MQKVFSLLYNDHPLYKKCLSLRQIPDWVDYELITERVLTDGKRTFAQDTDIDRLWRMQQDPNAWYLDADVVINKWVDFSLEPGFVYIGQTGDLYDIWCILGNGCKWFFDHLMDFYYKQNGNVENLWAHKIIRTELSKYVKPLPEGYFQHIGLSGAVKVAESTGNEVAGYRFSVKFSNGVWDLKVC